MEWINLHTSLLDSDEFLRAIPAARSTWLCLLRYCCGQENGGRIVDAASWRDTDWQQIVRVKLRDIRTGSKLWSWDGNDLIVWQYPVEKEREVQARRETAKANGRTGGRPHTQRQKTDIGSNHKPTLEPTSDPTLVISAKAEGEGEGNEKGNNTDSFEVACAPSGSAPVELFNEEPQKPTEPPVMSFQTVGNGKEWHLYPAKIAEYAAAFPGISVEVECRKARQWITDNPTRRKTPNGMPTFLFRWLERAQNSNRGQRQNETQKSEFEGAW